MVFDKSNILKYISVPCITMFALKYHHDKKINEKNINNHLLTKKLYEFEITNMKLNKRIKYIDPKLYNHNAIENRWFYELYKNSKIDIPN